MLSVILFATISWVLKEERTPSIRLDNVTKTDLNGILSRSNNSPIKRLLTEMQKTYEECEADRILNEAAFACYSVTKYVDNVPQLEQFNLILATFLFTSEDASVDLTVGEFSYKRPLYYRIFEKFTKSDRTALVTNIDVKSLLEASKAFASGIFSKTNFKYKARSCAAVIKRVEMNPNLFEQYLNGVKIALDEERNTEMLKPIAVKLETNGVNNEKRMHKVLLEICITMFWQPNPECQHLDIYDEELTKNSELLSKWNFNFEAIQEAVSARAVVIRHLLGLK